MGRTKSVRHSSCQRLGKIIQLSLILLSLLISSVSWSKERLNIAVASNFRAPLVELITLFNVDDQFDIRISSAASGVLARQIEHGAPFDLFFSADAQHTQHLYNGQLIEAPFHYASGQLVIIANKPELTHPDNLKAVSRIAIANPDIAPYGRAASESIKALRLKPKRIIHAPSVAQAYQIVHLAHADAAIVAASLISDELHHSIIPSELYGELRQEAAIINHCNNCELARAFKAFLRTDAARRIIKKYHYRLVGLVDG